MSMTETPVAPPAKPKRHARANRRKRVVAQPAAPKPAGIFEGMTVAKCPNACTAQRCVISERPVCAHPSQGGLQTSMQTPEALARFKAAQRFLGERKLDLTTAPG